MPIGIEMNNYDISMGSGGLLFSPGGGIRGNVSLNGNVGIGTTAPTGMLHIGSDTTTSTNYRLYIDQGRSINKGIAINNSNYGSSQALEINMVNAGSSNYYSYAKIQGTTSGVAATTHVAIQPGGGYVGIGKINPTAALDVSGAVTTSAGITATGIINTTNATSNNATDTTTGALVVTGGASFGSGITTGSVTNLALTTASGGGNRYVEIGSSTNTAHIDFHSQDTRTLDYDARIFSTGGTLTTGSAILSFAASQVDTTGILKTTNTTASTTTTNGALVVAGGVGIGGTVHIGSSTLNPLLLQSDATNSYIRPTGVSSTLYIGTGANNFLTLTSTGSVGIGISSPAATLDVSGDIRARGEIQFQFGADYNSSFQIKRGVSKSLLIQHYSSPSADVCFINNLAGGNGETHVGIDITAPLYPLDVSGACRINNLLNIRAPGESEYRSAYIESTLTDFYILNQKAGALKFGTNNAEDMRIDRNGNVGIGKTNPTSALDVSGTIKTKLIDTQNFDISMGTGMVKFGNNNASLSINSLVFSSTGNFTSFTDTPTFHSITYGNGQFVAVGTAVSTNARVATSLDGTTWNRISITTGSWTGVACSPNGLFVAVSSAGTNRSMYSTNAINWTPLATPADTSTQWSDVCHGGSPGNEKFVAVSGNGRVIASAYSASAITGWGLQSSSDNNVQWSGVCYGYTSAGIGLYVAVGSGGTVNRSMYSTDEGVTWFGKATLNNLEYFKVCYGNGTFVAIAGTANLTNGSRVMYTRNIITDGWSAANYPVENQWMCVTYGDGLFVAVAKNNIGNRVMISLDGINWTIRSTSGLDYVWNSVSYGNGRFVAVAPATNGVQTMINNYSAPCIKLDTNNSGYSINLNSSSIYLGNYTATNSGFTPNIDNVSSLGTTATRWTAVYALNGAIQTSDSLLKIYEPLAYGITQIKQIETIKFKWKETPNEKEKDFEYFGFKAENLRDIFPELVYDEDENNGVPLQVNYNEILPVCVKAIQEQQETIESQKSIIESLQEQLQTFEQRLSALESK